MGNAVEWILEAQGTRRPQETTALRWGVRKEGNRGMRRAKLHRPVWEPSAVSFRWRNSGDRMFFADFPGIPGITGSPVCPLESWWFMLPVFLLFPFDFNQVETERALAWLCGAKAKKKKRSISGIGKQEQTDCVPSSLSWEAAGPGAHFETWLCRFSTVWPWLSD